MIYASSENISRIRKLFSLSVGDIIDKNSLDYRDSEKIIKIFPLINEIDNY
jgi:hypothetical protein